MKGRSNAINNVYPLQQLPFFVLFVRFMPFLFLLFRNHPSIGVMPTMRGPRAE
jgi:hypothetical protein